MINLITKVLKVLQVSVELFFGVLRTQKVDIFDLPLCEYTVVHFGTYPPSVHACIHKMIHNEKRKKNTKIFYLYLKEVRLIKKTGLEHFNSC